VNTEILEHPQPEIGRDRVKEDLRKHPVPTRAPGQEPARWTPTIPLIKECDLLIASSLTSLITLKTQPFAESWRLVKSKRVREIERELQTYRDVSHLAAHDGKSLRQVAYALAMERVLRAEEKRGV